MTSEELYGSFDWEDDHAFPDDRVRNVVATALEHPRVEAAIMAQNVNPVTRLGYNDHGPEHIDIVLNRSLSLYDLMKRAGVSFNGAADHGLDEADEPVIIALGALLHDVGNMIHREAHSEWSIPLAIPMLERILSAHYDVHSQVKITGEVLHAIICHHANATPLTKEAGVVRVADGLDMERGRSRKPYESGGRGINTVSSQSIESVNLYEGDRVPVRAEIEMTNAAGVYQVDSLLKSKLEGSRIEEYVRIIAVNIGQSGDRIVDRVEL